MAKIKSTQVPLCKKAFYHADYCMQHAKRKQIKKEQSDKPKIN